MGKTKEPVVNQPTLEEQRQYKSLEDNTPTEITIPRTKKKYLIHWLKHCQLEYLTKLLIRKKKNSYQRRKAVMQGGRNLHTERLVQVAFLLLVSLAMVLLC